MLEYNRMKLTPKQILGQHILAHHTVLRVHKLTLMYTPTEKERLSAKSAIIVSVSKKTTSKATARNYIKRVLRATTRQALSPAVFSGNNWFWICKEPKITPELRREIINLLSKLTP